MAPAASLVTSLAAPAQAALNLTYVVKLPTGASKEEFMDEMGREALQQAKEYLISAAKRLQETLSELKFSITWSIEFDSDVADALMRIAEPGNEEKQTQDFAGYDLIAMSTHGRGGLERWIMGSVTQRVLTATRLPMLIVRPTNGE